MKKQRFLELLSTAIDGKKSLVAEVELDLVEGRKSLNDMMSTAPKNPNEKFITKYQTNLTTCLMNEAMLMTLKEYVKELEYIYTEAKALEV